MEETKEKNRKRIISIIGLLIIITGVSYAYWNNTVSQKTTNIVKSGCLKLEISDETEAINLSEAYPISDEEAEKLAPYTFRVTNSCNNNAKFDINLEILETEEKLASKYIAIAFNNNPKEILNSIAKSTPTYNQDGEIAYEAYHLESDVLRVKESKEYSIKLWMDSSVEDIEAMNKTFESKITVTGEIIKEEEPVLAMDYLKKLEKTNNELIQDEFGNIRYIGKNPNNYVEFNNELWRIIGVMKDIENEDGTKSDKIKLIRNESIGNYSWDNKPNGTGSSVTVRGSNIWEDSALQILLNKGAYYNRTNGVCPNGQNGATTACDFSTNGLTDVAKNQIANVVWPLGNIKIDSIDYNVNEYYNLERENNLNNHWLGKVGLMYPSDYGYATGGDDTTRNNCYTLGMFDWNNVCTNNNWLANLNKEWTILPFLGSKCVSFSIEETGYMSDILVIEQAKIRPVIFLDTNLKIFRLKNGTASDPYTLTQ